MSLRNAVLILAVAAAGCGVTVRPIVQPRSFEEGGGAPGAILVEYTVRCEGCSVRYTVPPRDSGEEENVSRITRRFQFYQEYEAGSVAIWATPSDSTHIEEVSIRFDGRVVASSTRTGADHAPGETVRLSAVLVFN